MPTVAVTQPHFSLAMASISVLLTLPQTSRGLAELRHTVSEIYLNDTGSASPRRKVPRLDTDSDSASASRSQATVAQKLVPGFKKSGSVTIHFDGHGLGESSIFSRPGFVYLAVPVQSANLPLVIKSSLFCVIAYVSY